MSDSDAFSSIYSVDLTSGEYFSILRSPVYCSYIAEEGLWSDLTEQYKNNTVVEEDREVFAQATTLEHIRAALNKSGSLCHVEYRRTAAGHPLSWCRAAAVASDFDDEDRPTRFIFTMSDITAEKELRHTKDVYDFSLSGVDVFLWELDLIKDQITFADNPFTLKRKAEIGYPDVVPNASKYIMVNVMPESIETMQGIFDDIYAGKDYAGGIIHFRAGGDQGYTVCRISYRVIKDKDGKPVKAYGSEQNITDRLLAQNNYSRETSKIEADTEEFVFRMQVNLTRNKIMKVTPDLFGLMEAPSYDDVLGKPYFVKTTTADGKTLASILPRGELIKNFADGERHKILEYRYPGEIWKWIRVEFTIVQNPATSDVEMFMYCTDITRDRIQEMTVGRLTDIIYDHIGIVSMVDGSYMMQSVDGITEYNASRSYVERVADLAEHVPPEQKEETLAAFDFGKITEEIDRDGIYIINTEEIGEDGVSRFKMRQMSWLDDSKSLLLVCVSDVTNSEFEKRQKLQENEALRSQILSDQQIIQKSSMDAYDFLSVIDVASEIIELRGGSWFNGDVPTPDNMKILPYVKLIEFVSKNYAETEEAGAVFRERFKLSNVINELEKNQFIYFPFNFKDASDINRVKYKQFRFSWMDDEHTKILATRADVTSVMEKEKETNDQLRDALLAAESANAAKSDFLSRMSHDIRTPMNAIIGFSTLLLNNPNDPEKVEDQARKILSSSNHLLGLINDVLDMSKIETGKYHINLREFKLSEAISMIDQIMRPQMEGKKQKFDLYVSGVRHNTFIADDQRLQQILINILSNATKYTQSGGSIALRVKGMPETSGKYESISFEVKDNGRGMTEEYQKVIFEPFSREQLKNQDTEQGTGLGMAITRNLVNMMGGTISLESKLGEGSTFTVTLPMQLPDEDKDLAFWTSHDLTHMLVVDDEEEVCRNVIESMKGTGVNLEYALSGEAGVRMLESAHGKQDDFDVVLLDWKMPGMDGVETARQIRATLPPEVLIIILTAYDYSSIEEEAKAAGVDGFVQKPFFIQGFEQAVRDSDTFREMKSASIEIDSGVAEVEYSLEGLKILAAEDNELNAEILREILKMNGADVVIEPDGQKAFENFKNSPVGTYDLILMDIQMPVMNGYEAAEAIRDLSEDEETGGDKRAEAGNIAIVAMTANAFADDIQNALNAGMNAHIAKPIDISVFKRTIGKMLG